MKKNEERILRYISDLMNDKEKSKFESELKASPELKETLHRISDSFLELDYSYNDADERYFTNLLPKVRERLNLTDKKSLFYGWRYVLPVVSICIIAGLFLIKPVFSHKITSEEIVREIVNNINDEKVSDNYISDLDVDIYNTTNSEESVDVKNINLEGINGQEILNSYYYPVSEEFLSVQKLSDEELKGILNKIGTKNTY